MAPVYQKGGGSQRGESIECGEEPVRRARSERGIPHELICHAKSSIPGKERQEGATRCGANGSPLLTYGSPLDFELKARLLERRCRRRLRTWRVTSTPVEAPHGTVSTLSRHPISLPPDDHHLPTISSPALVKRPHPGGVAGVGLAELRLATFPFAHTDIEDLALV